MPEQTVRRPLDEADLDDHLRPHPMHPRQHQRRSEPAAAWRRLGERHLVDRERPETVPHPLKLGDRHPGADAAGIDQSLSVRRVVAEQQRPDPMPAALRIAPADDDKFLPVEALGLQPGAPVGLVPAVDPLRDDALQAALAGQTVEGRATADLMIAVPERRRRAVQQFFQPGLAVDQGQPGDVLAVDEQQIEQEEDQRSLAGVARRSGSG